VVYLSILQQPYKENNHISTMVILRLIPYKGICKMFMISVSLVGPEILKSTIHFGLILDRTFLNTPYLVASVIKSRCVDM
jgi:hypothetical protein